MMMPNFACTTTSTWLKECTQVKCGDIVSVTTRLLLALLISVIARGTLSATTTAKSIKIIKALIQRMVLSLMPKAIFTILTKKKVKPNCSATMKMKQFAVEPVEERNARNRHASA